MYGGYSHDVSPKRKIINALESIALLIDSGLSADIQGVITDLSDVQKLEILDSVIHCWRFSGKEKTIEKYKKEIEKYKKENENEKRV